MEQALSLASFEREAASVWQEAVSLDQHLKLAFS